MCQDPVARGSRTCLRSLKKPYLVETQSYCSVIKNKKPRGGTLVRDISGALVRDKGCSIM